MATTARKSTANKPVKKIIVDFTGVEAGGLVPEGDVMLVVKEVTLNRGEKGDYLKWKFSAAKPHAGIVYHNTSTSKESLWALKTLFLAMNIDIPDGPLELEFSDFIDEKVGATIYHEEYDGKMQARISGFYNAETGEVSDDDKAADDEDSMPKMSAEEINEMSDDDLAGVVEKYELEVDLKTFPTARKRKNALIDAMESAGHLEAE